MIIQFSHNGSQINFSRSGHSKTNNKAYRFDDQNTGIRYWNNEETHFRKFIKHKGWYLQNTNCDSIAPQPQYDDLYFWGEWEAQSRFQMTGHRDPSLPNAIHEPFYSPKGHARHNTDPFVFGEHFYYTNCKQSPVRTGRILLDLPQYSIILFGSELNRQFIIDTVFVTDQKESVKQYKSHPENYPDLLRFLTIDLHAGLDEWHTLYKGKMLDTGSAYNEQSNQQPFCFFPCKVGSEGANGFSRPVIDFTRFKLKTPGAGTVLQSIYYSSDLDFWRDIVAELILQGYSLGIKLDIPKIDRTVPIPEYEGYIKNKCKPEQIMNEIIKKC